MGPNHAEAFEGEPVSYVVEMKIDGVACSLTYEAGMLTVAATRGDGQRGDDVTHNIRTIAEAPLRLQTDEPPPLFELRGEVYMTRAGSSASTANAPPTAKNPTPIRATHGRLAEVVGPERMRSAAAAAIHVCSRRNGRRDG